MAIHVLTGRPGEGKTYLLTKKAIEFLKEGREVWSNYWIKPTDRNLQGKIHYYEKVNQLVSVENGVILMDEGHIYFNARNWEKLDEKFQYKLQQHRKDGLDIWCTAQNVKRLDVIMRELVSNYYECKKVFALKLGRKEIGLFVRREFDMEDSEKPDENRHCWGTEWHWLDPKVYKAFDTLQKIPIPKEMGVITREFRRCHSCGKLERV